jgi:hypothetical protein
LAKLGRKVLKPTVLAAANAYCQARALANVSFEAGAAPFISRLLLLASSVSIKERMIDLC